MYAHTAFPDTGSNPAAGRDYSGHSSKILISLGIWKDALSISELPPIGILEYWNIGLMARFVLTIKLETDNILNKTGFHHSIIPLFQYRGENSSFNKCHIFSVNCMNSDTLGYCYVSKF